MKKLYTIIAALVLSASVYAQSPEKMSYQAIVRDANNNLLNSQAVGMQMSIIQGSADGVSVYVETQNKLSNANGLISLEIGTGDVVAGDFSSIDWANGPFFIKTETDPTGGSNYTITGVSQLLSVPYALYAESSGSSIPGPQGPAGLDGVDGAEGPMGPQGPAGADGIDGEVGPQGPIGETGAVGPMGPQGPAGLDGVDGVDGAVGPMGPQGPAGLDGADGLDGAVGPMGPQGPIGETGAVGPMGPQGPAGLDGADGVDGAVGPMGPQGPAGLDGADGEVGPMGPQGPAGLDGADGIDGATGPMGPQGPAGLDGADGLDGATGPMGPQGPAGETGATGPQGPAGTYTAGSGIEISDGVISATATGSSEMPEYAYVYIGNSSAGGAQSLTSMFPAATYVNGVVMNGSSITLHANKLYEVSVSFYIYNASGGHVYKLKDNTNNQYLGTEIYFGQGGADISYNLASTSCLIKPSTDIELILEKTQGTDVNLIGKMVVKEIK
ncbi:MAG TPA: hypothetical protein VJ949_07890 [Cryomorphaceae bacterium]|nr:hypothetical protein [Cryomorphaceae bacterium]